MAHSTESTAAEVIVRARVPESMANVSLVLEEVLASSHYRLPRDLASPAHCPLLERSTNSARQRPFLIGAMGTSITFGAELAANHVEEHAGPHQFSWPSVLQRLLAPRFPNVRVLNGATRASGADSAALCYEHLWSKVWRAEANKTGGETIPGGDDAVPPLDLAVIEYTWTSSTSQVEALVQRLHSMRIPVIGFVYFHPANPFRFGHVKRDRTPWKNADTIGKQQQFANMFRRYAVPTINNSALNAAYRYCDPSVVQRCQMPLLTRSKRHPSHLLHAYFAKAVAQQILLHCNVKLAEDRTIFDACPLMAASL